MYFSVSSVIKYHNYMAIHFHHIQFLSKALWSMSYSNVFLSKNKDFFGNENPKTTSLQWFKFGIYLSIFIRLIASIKILEHITVQLSWATTRLLVTRFIVQSTQWMKEMRMWGWSEISSYCFFVWCESSSFLRLKSQDARGVSQLYCFS